MKILFNSSMPRSGSTLLQNVLAQNPSIYASPTSDVLELLYSARSQYTNSTCFKAQDSKLMENGWHSYCKYALEGWYKGITDKPIAIDKSRGWLAYYEWLSKFIDSPKIIVCVRDLRFIAASMEKKYRKNLHKNDNADNPSEMKFITVQQRVANWLNTPPVGLAALRIMDSINRGNVKNFCIVRYEDLMKNPNGVMKNLYKYIEEPYYQHNFNHIDQVTKEDDNQHDFYGDHTIRPKLEKSTTDPEVVLGANLCNDIYNGNKWYFDHFYSSVSNFY